MLVQPGLDPGGSGGFDGLVDGEGLAGRHKAG